MINELVSGLTATARNAGLVAQEAAARSARRIATIAVVALIAAAAVIGAMVFFALALHRVLAEAASPAVADLVLGVILLVIAVFLIAVMASMGRVRRMPVAAPARPLWHRTSGVRMAMQTPPPPGVPFPPIDRGWIFGAVAAAFLVGIGLGRR